MIYIIKAVGTNLYKIGYTSRNDFSLRLNELQNTTASPHYLELLLLIDGSEEDEKTIHRALSKFRVSGEWFEVDVDKMWLVTLSSILNRKPKYKIVHYPSDKYKDFLKDLWTPKYFIEKFYEVNTGITLNQVTGISIDELWNKYVEVASAGNLKVNKKSEFIQALSVLGIPNRIIENVIYYNLSRKI